MAFQPDTIECGNCGHENAPGTRFCKLCGADFSMGDYEPEAFTWAWLLRWAAYIAALITVLTLFYLIARR